MIKKLFKVIYHILPKKQRKKTKHYYKLFCSLYKNYAITFIRPFLKNKKIKDINFLEQRFYSQNGEDGIIRTIFDKIGTTNKFCVEFGIQPTEGNTIYLRKKKWNCLWMDGDRKSDGKIIKKEYITAENINALFEKYNVPKEFDLLSIDIDFNDYWIWKAIDKYTPRVVIIEYNASIPPTESKVVKYNKNTHWDGTNYFGASLLALEKLGKSKGYTLIACDKKGINAFFIKTGLIRDGFQIKEIKDIYNPPHYGKKVNGKYIGHPKSDKSMISI